MDSPSTFTVKHFLIQLRFPCVVLHQGQYRVPNPREKNFPPFQQAASPRSMPRFCDRALDPLFYGHRFADPLPSLGHPFPRRSKQDFIAELGYWSVPNQFRSVKKNFVLPCSWNFVLPCFWNLISRFGVYLIIWFLFLMKLLPDWHVLELMERHQLIERCSGFQTSPNDWADLYN